MQRSPEKLAAEILSLPAQSRAFLAEKLIESLDLVNGPALDIAWKNEVARRCKEIDENQIELIPSDEAFSKVLSTIS